MNIGDWRKLHDVTQEQLAQAIGTSRPHLSKVERGATEPSPDLAKRIETYTRGEVTAASLLGLSEPRARRRGVREDAESFVGGEQLTISLTVPADQARTLQRAGADLQAVARDGAAKALKEAEAKAWAEANREAIEASSAWIEKHGTLAEQLGLI
jgi:transcriptional regulator with XRE-family HTH domain